MIIVIRTASIAPGRGAKAREFSEAAARHLKDKHGLFCEQLTPVGGNPASIGWMIRYESLADFETRRTRINADTKYAEMIAEASENFIAGSLKDEIWRVE